MSKVSKYLNSLPEESPRFPEVTAYIDAQSEMLKTDPTNVFVYIKLVFEKMRNKKIDPKSGAAHWPSDISSSLPNYCYLLIGKLLLSDA